MTTGKTDIYKKVVLSMKVRIKKHGKEVWFTVDGHTYHTNSEGSGLWYGKDWSHQKIGTCDFHLHQKTNSGMRKAIVKLFDEKD